MMDGEIEKASVGKEIAGWEEGEWVVQQKVKLVVGDLLLQQGPEEEVGLVETGSHISAEW